MEGYLHKRGRGKSISIYKPYARRYFVLSPATQELAYYADESRKSYRGTVSVQACQVHEVSKAASGKSNCFDLKCNVGMPHEEVITLAAPNENQLVEWITKIEEVGGATVTWIRERNLPSSEDKTEDKSETKTEGKSKSESESEVAPDSSKDSQREPEPEPEPERTSDEVDDKMEHVKNAQIMCKPAMSSQWTMQLCSLSYDFKELSFLADKPNRYVSVMLWCTTSCCFNSHKCQWSCYSFLAPTR
jgi:hypothetical protein